MKLTVKRRKPRKTAKCPELYKLHDKLTLAYSNGALTNVNMSIFRSQFRSDQSIELNVPLPSKPILVRGDINAVDWYVELPPSITTKAAIRRHIRVEGLARIERVIASFLKDVPSTTYVHRCDTFPSLSAVPYEFVVWIDFAVTIRAMGEGRFLYPYAEGFKLDSNGKKRAAYAEQHVEQLLCIGCGPDIDGEVIETILAITK